MRGGGLSGMWLWCVLYVCVFFSVQKRQTVVDILLQIMVESIGFTVSHFWGFSVNHSYTPFLWGFTVSHLNTLFLRGEGGYIPSSRNIVTILCFPFQPTQIGILFTFLARQMARHDNTIIVNKVLFDQVNLIFDTC